LDISIPVEDGDVMGSLSSSASRMGGQEAGREGSYETSYYPRETKTNQTKSNSTAEQRRRQDSRQKHLFTVKRGGIAGYLGKI
jgi:hypothetical protein